jgi:EAL domain-containing protein (putative c-di-GMP-specific phosphodiesterase class I)
MALGSGPIPIETNGHIARSRRTAAYTRIAMGLAGAGLTLAHPQLVPHPALAVAGFAVIFVGSFVQIAAPRLTLLSVEEGISGVAGLLIIGLGSEHVGVLSLLWLVAVASGVLARGGRVHFLGRYVVLCSLVLPMLRYEHVSGEYAAFCVATLGLLLTSGRLTRELNALLRQARLHADSVETLLLAGDLASRMAATEGRRVSAGETAKARTLDPQEVENARSALVQLIEGDGLSMVVQPIVDIRNGRVHAYEALARFGIERPTASPLHWFAMADELGGRPALERACLRRALALFPDRPPGTSMSVNLSAPVLVEDATMSMLMDAADAAPGELHGLIIEITEETLVKSDEQLRPCTEPLRRRGVCLAVDDMGAGYSGLRQITAVLPTYLKLDKALCSGIDTDPERAALVGALAGYSTQVGGLLIAEGVETAAELVELRRLGVPLVQGFLLGRPAEPWPSIDFPVARPEPVGGQAPALPGGVSDSLDRAAQTDDADERTARLAAA